MATSKARAVHKPAKRASRRPQDDRSLTSPPSSEAIAAAMLFQWEGAIEPVVSESERDAADGEEVQMTEAAQELRDAKEAIERVIAVLRKAGLPVPIELSEAARALSRELRPKAIRLEHVTIN